MATVTINIPDAQATAVRDAFAVRFGFDPAGSETKTQFMKRKLADYIKEVYQNYTAGVEANNARIASLASTAAVDIN